MITTHARKIRRGQHRGFYKGFVKVSEETENHGEVTKFHGGKNVIKWK